MKEKKIKTEKREEMNTRAKYHFTVKRNDYLVYFPSLKKSWSSMKNTS